jgi:hypothetical protein
MGGGIGRGIGSGRETGTVAATSGRRPLVGRWRLPAAERPDDRLPTTGSGRRPLLGVASVLVMVVSALGFLHLYERATSAVAVVVATESIPAGTPFDQAHLGVATVSISGGGPLVSVADDAVLRGRTAAVAIPAGSPLVLGDLSDAPVVPPGDAVVGVALKDGTYPPTGLTPGDHVMLVQTAAPGSSLSAPGPGGSAGTGVLVPSATVTGVTQPEPGSSSGATSLASVAVPSTLAAAVSTAAAAGQVSVVLLPAGGAGADSGSGADRQDTTGGAGAVGG